MMTQMLGCNDFHLRFATFYRHGIQTFLKFKVVEKWNIQTNLENIEKLHRMAGYKEEYGMLFELYNHRHLFLDFHKVL